MAEIYLLPGEFYFGSDYKVIKTMLGSCVAVTMWSPRLKVGGMCHYKLPRKMLHSSENDTNYGDVAFKMFMKGMLRYGLKSQEMTVGVFGGGDMFGNLDKHKSVSVQNIKFAHQQLKKNGFSIKFESIGGRVSRKVFLDVVKGEVGVENLKVGSE